jgi:hypothetical protein
LLLCAQHIQIIRYKKQPNGGGGKGMGDKDRKETGSTTHLIEDTRLHSRAVSCTSRHCAHYTVVITPREDSLAPGELSNLPASATSTATLVTDWYRRQRKCGQIEREIPTIPCSILYSVIWEWWGHRSGSNLCMSPGPSREKSAQSRHHCGPPS